MENRGEGRIPVDDTGAQQSKVLSPPPFPCPHTHTPSRPPPPTPVPLPLAQLKKMQEPSCEATRKGPPTSSSNQDAGSAFPYSVLQQNNTICNSNKTKKNKQKTNKQTNKLPLPIIPPPLPILKRQSTTIRSHPAFLLSPHTLTPTYTPYQKIPPNSPSPRALEIFPLHEIFHVDNTHTRALSLSLSLSLSFSLFLSFFRIVTLHTKQRTHPSTPSLHLPLQRHIEGRTPCS